MKIAVVIPPFTSIPVKGQGGTERIAQGMIEELIKRGHQVTLIGAGNCQTNAKFVQIFKKTISGQVFNPALTEASRPLRIETAYVTKVMKYLIDHDRDFDVIYNHMRGGYLLLPIAEKLKTPIITICHLPFFEEMVEAVSSFKNPNLISISNAQRKLAKNRIKFLATVYNGINPNEFKFNNKPKDYFLFMGAMGEHKAPHLAIKAAQKAGVKLILAGGKIREPYFSDRVKPLIDGQQIKYIGEASGAERINSLRYAKGFLSTTQIAESFGLTIIESMASGTPVIALENGAIREIIDEGTDGYVVKNIEQMADVIKRINQIKRRKCRDKVEQKFTYQKMVDGYLDATTKVI